MVPHRISLHAVCLAALGPLCLYSQQPAPAKPTHHHVQVEEEGTSTDFAHAADLLNKGDYTAAEPLLKSVTTAEPSNYAAWFDLGFVENALGKVDDSVAAYRKSIASKPGVFESNLNLGLQLAKQHDPQAETYLRAATTLTPEKDANKGLAAAWLSLGHVLEKSKPDDALAAFQKAATLAPSDPEPHLSAGPLLESANRFADAEREYKQAQSLDPKNVDAAIALATLYARPQISRCRRATTNPDSGTAAISGRAHSDGPGSRGTGELFRCHRRIPDRHQARTQRFGSTARISRCAGAGRKVRSG